MPPPEQVPSTHAPQRQVEASHDRVRVARPRPQLPHATLSDCVSPAAHSPDDEHALHVESVLHRQSAPQVRARVRVPPQPPQASLSVSLAPAAHSRCSVHDHAPQVQSG